MGQLYYFWQLLQKNEARFEITVRIILLLQSVLEHFSPFLPYTLKCCWKIPFFPLSLEKSLIVEPPNLMDLLKIFLEYMGMTEEEFNQTVSKMIIPPTKSEFNKNEFSKKLNDFDEWYREDNSKKKYWWLLYQITD